MELSPNAIQIRQATVDDIPQLCRLWQNLEDEKTVHPFGGDCPTATAERIHELVSYSVRSDKAIALIAEDHPASGDNPTVLGTVAASLYEKPTVLLPNVAVVYSLWITPEFRRLGIARGLVDFLESELREMGAQSLQVAWDSPNTPAATLWQQLGYTPYEVIASKNLESPPERS